jgi:hypothetical protein
MKDFVLRLLQAAEVYNLDQKDIKSLCLKVLILSLKYVDRRAMFETLFPGQFADWEKAQITFGDAVTWLTMLGLMSWKSLTDNLQVRDVLLEQTKAALKKNNIDMNGWDVACKVLILQMIVGLQSVHAIELLTTRLLNTNTRQSTVLFLASTYDNKHPPETYTRTLTSIIENAHVDVDTLQQTMRAIMKEKEDRTMHLRIKSIQLTSLRPRLRDKMQTSLEDKEDADARTGTWNTYKGFCHIHRFPNNMSERIKKLLYFMASQTNWDWNNYVNKVIQNRDLELRIVQRPITHPDVPELLCVINTLSMDGKKPFAELMAFKIKAFTNFPVVFVQSMSLTQLLQLYTIAYQPHWKELWKSHIGVLSPHIVRDVETFVQQVQFNGERAMEIFCSA